MTALYGDVASGDMIALSIEVPPIFDRKDPHPLCGDEVFFKAQSCHRWLTFQRQFSMSAITPIVTKLLQCRDCPLCAISGHLSDVTELRIKTGC
jgi:hypothetical protein